MTIIYLVRPVDAAAATDHLGSTIVYSLFAARSTTEQAIDQEPSPDDLAAIDAEWPLIAAEMDLVDAEIRVLTAEPHPSELDWRRLRRAEARVGREAAALLGRGLPVDWAA